VTGSVPADVVTVRGREWLVSVGFALGAVLAAANGWGVASGALAAAAAVGLLAVDGPITIDSRGVHRRWLIGVHRSIPWDDVAGLEVLVKDPRASSTSGVLTVRVWQASRAATIPALDHVITWQIHLIGQARATAAAEAIVGAAGARDVPARWRQWPSEGEGHMSTDRFWEQDRGGR
jgi:hypothetical protein